MRKSVKFTYTLVSLALMSTPALAHVEPGAASGMLAGITHPFLGIDHLLAMLAVGIWSVLAANKGTGVNRIWLPALVFLGAMIAGGSLGVAGVILPAGETAIALSVLVLGLMIVTRIELGIKPGLALIAGFAIFHGQAHGIEATGAIATYFTGFVLATATLQLAGMAVGTLITNIRYGVSVLGFTCAAAGVAMIAM